MSNASKSKSALNKVFEERRKFIVVGLTGRTGSGCTTAARLLASSFESFCPPRPVSVNFESDEDRKYKVLYEYLDKNWGRFHHIQLRDLITTFVLENDFGSFSAFLSSLAGLDVVDIRQKLGAGFEEDFNKLHEERVQAKLMVEKSEGGLDEDFIYDFYFKKVPEFTQIIRKSVDIFSTGTFTKLYQSFANNIRRSGLAYSDVFKPDNIYKLAQRANKLIKLLRRRSLKNSERVLVCLDAIRNPFEASFFRERYSSFYLMAISAHDSDRKARLRRDLNLTDVKIKAVDLRENPEKLKGDEFFFSQDIPRCIQLADVHIFNQEDAGSGYRELKKQLVKYLALMMHPGLVTPSRSERCMQLAFDAKVNSGCISRQVGAAVADANYSVKAIGWNDVAQGQTPCNLRNVEDLQKGEDRDAYSKYEKENSEFRGLVDRIYGRGVGSSTSSGIPCSFCFKDIQNSLDGEKNQVHTRALHAEENAFIQISKYGGQPLEGGVLFTTASPCELCSKKAYQIGITKIFYIDPYPGIAKDQILRIGGRQPDLCLFTGAVGRAYQQLFDPIMPYKEELKISEMLNVPNVKSELRARIKELEYKNGRLQGELDRLKEDL
ncbi:hypothetical protein FDP08_08100 [Marinobacter panjinensis]|uniref:CMP/dCMP-type deaminase domain-containing protein n=1 Tax=Marinobacter panjinensis TaxID=2576384 RepID=A0A4V6CU81_9GAMM|nr:hypothetical protein [Marinobacter panjinensis]MCR8913265.1 hypothetical protein [Marinobacter panjinensis]TKV68055.1 hypothetical protein FDP08_08100 [Marinobacter panjinensis]